MQGRLFGIFAATIISLVAQPVRMGVSVLLAMTLIWRWDDDPTRARLLVACALTGVAILAKLPALYLGIVIAYLLLRREGPPIIDLAPPKSVSERQQRGKLDLLAKMNQSFDRQNPADSELDARLQSYELAYRMQAAAPEAVDISTESEAIKELYGMNDPALTWSVWPVMNRASADARKATAAAMSSGWMTVRIGLALRF